MAVGALMGGAAANSHHAHHDFHKRLHNDTDVVCAVSVETITGDFICMSTSSATRPGRNFDTG